MNNLFVENLVSYWLKVEQQILERPSTNRNKALLDIWRSISLPVTLNPPALGLANQYLNPNNNAEEFEAKLKQYVEKSLQIFGDILLGEFKSGTHLYATLSGGRNHGGGYILSPFRAEAQNVFGVTPDKSNTSCAIEEAYSQIVKLSLGEKWGDLCWQMFEQLQPTQPSHIEQEIESNAGNWKSLYEGTIQNYPWKKWEELHSKYGFSAIKIGMDTNLQDVSQATAKVVDLCERMLNLFPTAPHVVSANGCSLEFSALTDYFGLDHVVGLYHVVSHHIEIAIDKSGNEMESAYIHEWMHAVDYKSRGFYYNNEYFDPRDKEIKPVIEKISAQLQNLQADPNIYKQWLEDGYFTDDEISWKNTLKQWLKTYGTTETQNDIEKVAVSVGKSFIKALHKFGDDSDKRRAVESVLQPFLAVNVPRNTISELISEVLKYKNLRLFAEKEFKKPQSCFMSGSKFGDYVRKQNLVNNANPTVIPIKHTYYTLPEEMLARAAEMIIPELTDMGYNPEKIHAKRITYISGQEKSQVRPLFEELVNTLNTVFTVKTSLSDKIKEKRQELTTSETIFKI